MVLLTKEIVRYMDIGQPMESINRENVWYMEIKKSIKKVFSSWKTNGITQERNCTVHGQPMVLLKKESVWYMANQWYCSRKKFYGIWLTNGTTQERNCMVYG